MRLNIHRFIPATNVEGPGTRACLWVQGCSIRCPGCAVPWTWPATGGTWIRVDDLANQISSGPAVEGVTFVGGEPFDQAAALAELGGKLRSRGLSVVTFTGYHLEEIVSSLREDWLALLAVSDILIDGPYRRELADLSRPWVGSSNQRYHFLTDRYRNLSERLCTLPNRVEIRLMPDGQILINGMAGITELMGLFSETHQI